MQIDRQLNTEMCLQLMLHLIDLVLLESFLRINQYLLRLHRHAEGWQYSVKPIEIKGSTVSSMRKISIWINSDIINCNIYPTFGDMLFFKSLKEVALPTLHISRYLT